MMWRGCDFNSFVELRKLIVSLLNDDGQSNVVLFIQDWLLVHRLKSIVLSAAWDAAIQVAETGQDWHVAFMRVTDDRPAEWFEETRLLLDRAAYKYGRQHRRNCDELRELCERMGYLSSRFNPLMRPQPKEEAKTTKEIPHEEA